jgi:signal peptidase I
MYPTLQNGDLVLFTRAPQMIANGTIIVFVQEGSGFSALDSLIRPVVIHRIVEMVVQTDGVICYRTKGDNNQLEDSGLVQSNYILGVESIVIPKVGIIVLFFESPFGLVLLIGLITLFYLGRIELYMNEEKKKGALLSALAGMVQRGELSRERFNRIELAVKHPESVQLSGSNDIFLLELLDWIRNGRMESNLTAKRVKCPKCSHGAIALTDQKKKQFVLCLHCASN